jgi:Spy/CpxP family protein refolding chaperone
MRYRIGLATLLVALGLVTSSAYPRTKASKASTQPVVGGAFAEDTKRLTAVVGLTDAQLQQIRDLKQQRDGAVAKWDATNQSRIAAIRDKMAKLTGKNSARSRAQLQRQLKIFENSRAQLIAGHDRKIFNVLTREQRGKWNGPILAEAVLKDFRALKLQPEQTAKVHELCCKRGEGVSVPVDPAHQEVTVKAVSRQVYTAVLTPDQRKQYSASRRPTPSPSKRKTASSAKKK